MATDRLICENTKGVFDGRKQRDSGKSNEIGHQLQVQIFNVHIMK